MKASSPAQMHCGWFSVPSLCSFADGQRLHKDTFFLAIKSQEYVTKIPKIKEKTEDTAPPANPSLPVAAALHRLQVAVALGELGIKLLFRTLSI